MNARLGRGAWLVVFSCWACGGSPPAADAPATAEPDPATAPAASAGGTEATDPGGGAAREPGGDAPAGGGESEAAGLARDLVKAGGRWIGWSASKKSFVHPQERRVGDVKSLDVVFTDEDGRAKDVVRICQAGDCEERMTELAKQAMPKLVSRLEGDGFVGVRAIGWPQGRDELDVSALGMKLRLTGGTLQGVRDGKPPVRLGGVKPKLLAVFVVPDSKLLGVFTSPDGETTNTSFSVLRIP